MEKTHPITVIGNTPSEEIGKEIIALRYDLIIPILDGMITESHRQQKGDTEKGRLKLANELAALEKELRTVKQRIENIITICAPYIEKEKAKTSGA